MRSLLPLCLVAALGCGARTPLLVLPEYETEAGPGEVDAATEPVGCVPGDISLTAAQPEVMFVLDRSGSMQMAFSGNESRWATLTSGLAQTLPPVDATMAIGALLFPSGLAHDDCSIPSQASLSPALHDVDPLISLMQDTMPGGGTPTADAITFAASVLSGVRAATTARALVLATDGAPNCNPNLDPATCTCASGMGGAGGGGGCRNNASQCLDDVRTVARIAGVYAQGVPTYVIGIANANDSTFSTVLNDMAQAGGRPLTSGSTSYYPALSASDLEAALTAIRDQVGACTYLTTSVPNAMGTIALTIGGQTVPFEPDGGASGWSWSSISNGQIVLLGAACEEVAGDAGVAVTAHVTCGTEAGTTTDAGGQPTDATLDHE